MSARATCPPEATPHWSRAAVQLAQPAALTIPGAHPGVAGFERGSDAALPVPQGPRRGPQPTRTEARRKTALDTGWRGESSPYSLPAVLRTRFASPRKQLLCQRNHDRTIRAFTGFRTEEKDEPALGPPGVSSGVCGGSRGCIPPLTNEGDAGPRGALYAEHAG